MSDQPIAGYSSEKSTTSGNSTPISLKSTREKRQVTESEKRPAAGNIRAGQNVCSSEIKLKLTSTSSSKRRFSAPSATAGCYPKSILPVIGKSVGHISRKNVKLVEVDIEQDEFKPYLESSSSSKGKGKLPLVHGKQEQQHQNLLFSNIGRSDPEIEVLSDPTTQSDNSDKSESSIYEECLLPFSKRQYSVSTSSPAVHQSSSTDELFQTKLRKKHVRIRSRTVPPLGDSSSVKDETKELCPKCLCAGYHYPGCASETKAERKLRRMV